jgi:hypothetical protein
MKMWREYMTKYMPQALAIFLCHSFDRQLVQRLVNRIVYLGSQAGREIFFIYENRV